MNVNFDILVLKVVANRANQNMGIVSFKKKITDSRNPFSFLKRLNDKRDSE